MSAITTFRDLEAWHARMDVELTQVEVALRLWFVPPNATRDLRAGIDRLRKLLYASDVSASAG